MSFSTGKKNTTFIRPNNTKILDGPSLNNFLGTIDSAGANILSLPYGSLQYNKNMEFISSGNKSFLRTKRGSSLIKDITHSVAGAGLFYDGTNKWPVWYDSTGNLRYLNGSTITDISSGKNTGNWELWMYQLGSNQTLYTSNYTDGLYKLKESGGVLIETAVLTTINISSMVFNQISGRMLLLSGHSVYYGGIQNQTALDTTNLENFNINTQFFNVSPDNGEGGQKLVDDGQITYIFKDTGIWAFINADQDISNWLIPKCDSEVGTRSPETVQYSRYGQQEGYIFLASDKTLRFFNGSVDRNSGAKPTLRGGSSKIISENFQSILDDIPAAQLVNCKAKYFNRYYILSIISSSSTEIDKTIYIDTENLLSRQKGQSINQPYWFFAEDVNCSAFIQYDYDTLYGFNVDGYIVSLLRNNQYYNELPVRIESETDYIETLNLSSVSGTILVGETLTGGSSGATGKVYSITNSTTIVVENLTGNWTPGETVTGNYSGATATLDSLSGRQQAIDWAAYLSWHKYSNKQLQFYDGYLHWSSETNVPITFMMNSFLNGEAIPAYDDTVDVSLKMSDIGGSYFDIDFFDLASFDTATSSQVSQNIGKELTGNYFSFGFKSSSYNSAAKIYGIDTRFKIYKNDVMGKNI